jgi:predicted  nucleic acid-binding Zn ribbon protein
MFVVEITWKIPPDISDYRLDEISCGLFGLLYQNGQIIGRDYTIARSGKKLRAFVTTLEPDSLDLKYANQYVKRSIEQAKELGISSPRVRLVGQPLGASKSSSCNCQPLSYILCTDFIEYGSPIKCGSCFADIPLYHLPTTTNSDDYSNVLAWMRDYRACDTLQMNCTTGERFGIRQMSDPNSSLSKQGREICDKLTALTNKPTYYNLYRYKSRSILTTERQRKCPSCNGKWLLDEPWHRYDFKCEVCRLVSTIAS